MLVLDVELLGGRYVATAYEDRNRAEWPPHPARIFSTLVATAHESAESDTALAAERAALAWLESQAAPEIQASDASHRNVATVFVPVNDLTALGGADLDLLEAERELAELAEAKPAAKRTAEKRVESKRTALHGRVSSLAELGKEERKLAPKLLPENRLKQGRTFPSVSPEGPRFALVWRETSPDQETLARLGGLAARVVRIGHSSSLVQCRIATTVPAGVPASRWIPDSEGEHVLRVVTKGQLERLDAEFERHRATEPRVLSCTFQRYRRAASEKTGPAPRRPVLDDGGWIIFRRVGGPRLQTVRTVDVAQALRGALLKHAGPAPEILSGHTPAGGPSETPHLAILPLANVGHVHADGVILGVALALPRGATEADRRHVLETVARWEDASRTNPNDEIATVKLFLQRGVEVELERLIDRPTASTLSPETWCRPSRTWVSATPVALDRNPGMLRSRQKDLAERARIQARAAEEAEATIADACDRIGLPRPRSVVVLPSVSLPGTDKAARFGPFPPEPGRHRRVKVHAHIEFAEPVSGPVVLGAGRYLGLGLFRPVFEGEGRREAAQTE